jgi:hypothetical protein
MIYHFVVGDFAAAPLSEAVSLEPAMAGEVVVLRDILHVGPLDKTQAAEEVAGFSEMRSNFWRDVAPNEKNPVTVDDMERLLDVSKKMYEDETAQAWFWMAPGPADVCAYYWSLPYLSKHVGRLYLVHIAGLPFLDENGKVFFPKNISNILPKELVKARRLARPVTPAEVEVDTEEWRRLTAENAPVRTHEGGKKIVSREEAYYDSQLIGFCTPQFQKASKIVSQVLSKYQNPTGDLYLGWRLRKLADAGKLQLQGDVSKTLKDFELKLFE